MKLSGNRRWALRAIAASAAVTAINGSALARTPSQTEGPFYPLPGMRFADDDNDLVKIEGAVREAGGEIIVLKGKVLDGNGVPVKNARVEIWQCDTNGRYLHTSETGTGEKDTAFQGFGHSTTGEDGAYNFRTIKPGSYPGRTPHIHVKILVGSSELTTQFYIADHPQNEQDGLYRSLSPQQRELVEIRFTDGYEWPEAKVDIIVA